jgi:hypothetical protein
VCQSPAAAADGLAVAEALRLIVTGKDKKPGPCAGEQCTSFFWWY